MLPVKRPDPIERTSQLLDSPVHDTANTSMRIQTTLRDAAAIAVDELAVAPSSTALTADALRTMLEAIVMQAALDRHYQLHPQIRPDLGDLAVAAAVIDRHPLAGTPHLVRQAALEIVARHPDATAQEVLLWAEARNIPAA